MCIAHGGLQLGCLTSDTEKRVGHERLIEEILSERSSE